MKKNKMNFLKTLTLLLFILSLLSCSEDLYETDNNNSKYKVSYINSIAIENNKELLKTLKEKKIIKTNSLNRIVIDTINNFSIDTDFVKFLQGPNFNSYTFKIIEQEENYLDNLVLVSQAGAPYSAFIMRYNLTEQEKIALNNRQAIDFTNKAKVLKLSNSNIANDALGKIIYREECNWVSTWEEVVTLSIDPDQCDCYGLNDTSVSHVLVGSWVCTGGGGGGDIGGDVGTSPNGGGGVSGSTTLVNPCNKIKKQLDKFVALKPALVTLKGTTSQNHENGIYIDNTAASTSTNPIQNLPATTAQGAAVGLPNLPTPNKYTIIAHTHDAVGPNNTGTYSIFSWGDLSAIADKIRLSQIDSDNFVFYVITADNTIYALTIDWPSAFSEYFDVNTNPNDPSQTNYFNSAKYAKLTQTSETYYKNEATVGSGKIGLATNANDDLKIFLQMIKKLKLDVTLFEVDTTFTTYTKKTLSSDGTVAPGTPCN